MKLFIKFIGITLLGLVLSSCIANSNSNFPETPDNSSLTPHSTDINMGDGYWDGGEFEGQSVYSLTQGVSQTAHSAFAACGLDDRVVRTLVDSYLERGAERQVLVAGDLESKPQWEVVMTVEPLTPDVFLVTCSGEKTE